MNEQNLLGGFLRARRELVKPAQLGIPVTSRRRVPGLRREEVAALARISPEYYLRLEQGRDRHPSEQVLRAIADALQLDEASRDHTLELARDRTPNNSTTGAVVAEKVPDGVQMLLATINAPAFVLNKYRDILAANPLATRVLPALRVGHNRLISLFTDAEARGYHPDWDESIGDAVAQLRADIGTDDTDPRYRALVGELSVRSREFRQLWARHDIRLNGSAASIIRHPDAGELRLHREKLALVGTGLTLVIYHAEAGSDSADRLADLASSLY